MNMWIYLQDRFVSKAEATLSVFDHGLLYGDGLFETFRAYSGKIFNASRHLDRLSNGSKQLGLDLPPIDLLEKRLYETLNRNGLREAMLRLTVTRGEGEIGLDTDLCSRPQVIIIARPFSGYPAEQYAKGVSAAIVRIRRNAPKTVDPSLKTISFLNNVLAKKEAKERGAMEGIFLTLEGHLSEGTISNLFWVRHGKLRTPSLRTGILEGITRGVVLELAKKSGLKTEEGFYRPSELYHAEEAFLTSSGLEIMPLTRVDDRKIGQGRPGPTTDRLLQAFREAVRDR